MGHQVGGMRYCHPSVLSEISAMAGSLSISHMHSHIMARELFLMRSVTMGPLKESYRFLLWVGIRVCFYPWLEQNKVFSGDGNGESVCTNEVHGNY